MYLIISTTHVGNISSALSRFNIRESIISLSHALSHSQITRLSCRIRGVWPSEPSAEHCVLYEIDTTGMRVCLFPVLLPA